MTHINLYNDLKENVWADTHLRLVWIFRLSGELAALLFS